MSVYENCMRTLNDLHIAYKEFNHAPILNYEDAEREQKKFGWSGVESKNVFIKSTSGKFFIIATVMGEKVDFAKIKELIGEKCSIASAEEVIDIAKCVPGCVAPFGFSENIKIYVDPKVFTFHEYLFSPGVTTKTIQINIDDLKKVFENERM